MKLYRESVRRLSRVGLTLLIVSVVMTVVMCAQNCVDNGKMLDSMFTLLPTMVYYTFGGGLALAYVGFSFLNKRADSDFYHSLPVKRVTLYTSITLAALSWIAATVVLSVLASLAVYTMTATPFVPAYYPFGALFFIVSTMLVFAAAAIACSITGTFLTNLILTGLILFLPRYILFLVARSIVDFTNIVGWLDFGWFLDPSTNIASGLVVMFSRIALKEQIINLGAVLYSLALTVIELGIGGLLFQRRPSELAEQGANGHKLQTVFACMVALPVLLMFLVRAKTPSVRTALVLLAASFACYVIYQIIVLKNARRVLLSLPWYLCPVALTVVMFFGVRAVSNAVLNTTPAADEIRHVEFLGFDRNYGQVNHTTVAISKIRFAEQSVKECVSDSLAGAAERVRNNKPSAYIDGDATVVEPICITLNNGRKIRRTIEFNSFSRLNAARNENAAFVEATHAFPPADSVTYRMAYGGQEGFTDEDVEKLRACYFDECEKMGAFANSYYHYEPRVGTQQYSGRRYPADGEQGYGDFTIGGYIGMKRYLDSYSITLATPKTAGLMMMLRNSAAGGDNMAAAAYTLDYAHNMLKQDDYFYISYTFTNVPMKDGTKQQISLGYSIYGWRGEDRGEEETFRPYVEGCMNIVKNGTETADPAAFSVYVQWDGRFDNQPVRAESRYMTFTAEEQKQLLELIQQWQTADYSRYYVQTGTEAPEIAVDAGE